MRDTTTYLAIACQCCGSPFYRDTSRDQGPVCDTCYDVVREYHDREIEKECFD